MGYTVLDRPHLTRELVTAIALAAVTLVRSRGDTPTIPAPEFVSPPEIDILDPVHVTARDDRAPDPCVPIAEVRVLRGHVTDGITPIEPHATRERSNGIMRLSRGHRFDVRIPPGGLENLYRVLDAGPQDWFRYQVHRRGPLSRLCVGDVWITLERHEEYSSEWVWDWDVVIDSIE